MLEIDFHQDVQITPQETSQTQTTFTTSVSYVSGKITVFCNGVEMRNGSDVTVTSRTQVVFATGLAVGTLVDLVYPR